MKVRFFQRALLLSLSMGSYALAETLMINDSLQEIPTDIKNYDYIVVSKDCTVNSIENYADGGTQVFAQADLTVNTDLDLRGLRADVYGGESKVTVNGDLNVSASDDFSGTVYNGKLALGSTSGKHELVVSGTTTVTGKANDWSEIGKSGTLTTEKLVINAGLSVNGAVYANEIEVNGFYLSVGNTGRISSKDGDGGTITISSGANVQLQQKATVDLDLVIKGGQVRVHENWQNASVPSLQDVTMQSGEFLLQNEVKTGDFTLNGGTLVFDFSYGKTPLLDLADNDFVIGENASITLKIDSMDNIADEYALFANAGNITELKNLEICIVDGQQNTQTVTASLSNGAVVLIPEPTTATLSLLALAGLAARRRRE